MQIGLICHDEMGFNLALNLKQNKYDVIAYDLNPEALETFQKQGIKTTGSIKSLAESLETKRVIWLMISTGKLVDQTIQSLQPYLSVGDIVVDGSDSFYEDTIRRSKTLEAFQIDFLDCGFSNVTDGAVKRVYAMIGGNRFAFNYCEQLFKNISINASYLYCGKSGSGHYAKMVSAGNEFEQNVVKK